ncbi:MAG: hypothetical protein PHE70_10945 [Tepidanaerobacteraceae bacterium]|nr:hypothetical protein [Tepidanaerobacteraceae bacterium]
MKKDEVFGRISIEESDIRSLKTIDNGYHTIKLENNTGQEVDGNEIAEYFSRIEGIKEVKTLAISYNSNLKDLMVIKGFPNLLNINVHGHKIKTFDGLEFFSKGSYLYINTDKNRSRSIANISQAPLTRLTLVYCKNRGF